MRKVQLKNAFEALRKEGLVVEENFWCCLSCGTAAIEPIGKEWGYVFYHQQDGEYMRKGNNLFLAYGAFGEDKKGVEVGAKVVEALSRHGLQSNWDGLVENRIEVINQ